MITGNIGEWSEIYVFLKLLSEGKLFSADKYLNKVESNFLPLIKILREEVDSRREYVRNGDIKVFDSSSKKILVELPINDFYKASEELLMSIRKSSGSSFSVPKIEKFLKSIDCKTIKAKNADKKDINVMVHDINSGEDRIFGFSIKSQLGGSSTLLNASQSTNFIYKINNIDQTIISKTNEINTKSKIKDRLNFIIQNKGILEFKKISNDVFQQNLSIIESQLPYMMSNILLYYYQGKATSIIDLVEHLEMTNPCNFNNEFGHQFYKFKIKLFLREIALGMTPSTMYTGKQDATGGYIIVKESGDVVCYHIYNLNDLDDYLYFNTKLETPSSSRHKFGIIYKSENEFLFNLNLQIRFNF